jgi:phosphatidylglycerophosphate synthase
VISVLFRNGEVDLAVVVLAAGWITDVLDGRLARAAEGKTWLGPIDVVADVALATGVGVGLVLNGRYGALPLALGAVVLLGSAAWYRNHMPAMIYMAIIDLALLATVFELGSWGRFVMVFVVVAILAVDHRRLVETLIPRFLDGAAVLMRGGRPRP